MSRHPDEIHAAENACVEHHGAVWISQCGHSNMEEPCFHWPVSGAFRFEDRRRSSAGKLTVLPKGPRVGQSFLRLQAALNGTSVGVGFLRGAGQLRRLEIKNNTKQNKERFTWLLRPIRDRECHHQLRSRISAQRMHQARRASRSRGTVGARVRVSAAIDSKRTQPSEAHQG